MGRVKVVESIHEAVVKIRPLADRKRLALVVEATGQPEAMADRLRLQQIVLNLLSNAVKFTPDGGKINVHVCGRGPVIEIDVSDNGIGIASEHLGQIFDEYSMVDDSYNRTQEGTGLGPALSRRLAQLMAGTLTVASVFGRGPIFRLRLQASSVLPTQHATRGSTSTPDHVSSVAAHA
mgnify:CR=1 FL=1